MTENKQRLGDAIFSDIDRNEYLNKIYENLLYNYALKVFKLDQNFAQKEVDIRAALRFADLLSKSNHPEKADAHKMWAQELVILINELFGNNPIVKMYAGSVFSNTGNHQGLQLINSAYQSSDMLERVFEEFRSEYLKIPAEPEKRFFSAQKIAYDHLKDPGFSYSGPTSMGKSFIMRMFIKSEVLSGIKNNYALIVPTKALINEVRGKIIDDLGENLKKFNYRVVTAASDIALEEEHNFIFVLTPERLLYMLISNPEVDLDYLFIDEAHKLSGKNSRGPFYYKVVDMLLQKEHRPHFIFASPNIPNPQVYLRLLNDAIETNDDNKLASTFSPVVQIKFLVEFKEKVVIVEAYNERENKRIPIAKYTSASGTSSLAKLLFNFEVINMGLPPEQRKQSIIYCNGRNKAISAAQKYSDLLKGALVNNGYKNDPELNSLSADISREVHNDYYLADMIKKGIAYHIGYLPASIRTRIEKLFQEGRISTMFCTSTLLEGVNLPADNLFITDNKIFLSAMSAIDFKNLIGRVGRISFNLYGNVFLVSQDDSVSIENYIDMLQTNVPIQELSVDTNPNVLKNVEKKYIAEILKSGTAEIPQRVKSQSEESYIMMRKFGLILLKDIVEDRDSLVRRSFSDHLSKDDEKQIRETFKNSPVIPDHDINTSVDQTQRLIIAIKRGLKYPDIPDGVFHHDQILKFLQELSRIFDWPKYESKTLGKSTLLPWYAEILRQWLSGYGLGYIMRRALTYRQNHRDSFYINPHQKVLYDDSLEHRNVVFANTLEVIEQVILFSIANYFLRFSNEYKKVHGKTDFDNNWYEFVEYGTTNKLTILLQRNGFSREAATYIKEHSEEYVLEDGETGDLKLKASLLNCGNKSVEMECAAILYNVPGIFVYEDDNPGDEDWKLSFIRTIECPNCFNEFDVDLEEYVDDISSYEKENGMGPDAVHYFDTQDECKCPSCGCTVHVTGWIREYPMGIFDSDEINAETIDDDDDE